jgi:hypothetical protein
MVFMSKDAREIIRDLRTENNDLKSGSDALRLEIEKISSDGDARVQAERQKCIAENVVLQKTIDHMREALETQNDRNIAEVQAIRAALTGERKELENTIDVLRIKSEEQAIEFGNQLVQTENDFKREIVTLQDHVTQLRSELE